MYKNYLSLATAVPTGGGIPVKELLEAVQELDENATFVHPNPTIVQDTDKDGNPRFQASGAPVYKSLDDNFVPIKDMTVDKIDVHATPKPVSPDVEAQELGADVSSAIVTVTNRYMSVASFNQSIDDQNTLHEKHGRLDQIKPLEDNPPCQIIVAVDEAPHLVKDLNRLSTGLKKLLTNSPISDKDDLRVVLLVFSDDEATRNYYSELKEKESLVDGLALIGSDAKKGKDELKALLSNLLV